MKDECADRLTADGDLSRGRRGAVVRPALAAAALMILGCGPGPPPVAVPSGASSDIQLWNVTDLAVRFLLDRLPPR